MKKFAFVLFFLPAMGAYATESASDLFTTLDQDGNGALTKEEASVDSRLAAVFEQMDADSDGQITRAEFDSFQGN
ncbi:EF-hand domain-containing protein [Bowmanella pacifica]|uniref:EF-hand domain-containing protein n=1 Tax=Bowmanella pacifica TaxID=502051 RepID=A0A918DI61_9ALTE|nr:EF-hand domain-containing protein [Bowmanella pacifica]GGO67871.1 hypothetical protein GCM10010982_15440 [Bowmanella pacifica]